MMVKSIFLFIALFFLSFLNKRKEEGFSFPDKKYDGVVFYKNGFFYEEVKEDEVIKVTEIDENGKIVEYKPKPVVETNDTLPFPTPLDIRPPIVYKGKLGGVTLPGKTLTQNQIQRLLSILNSKPTYGCGRGQCFNPGFGFVFYKKEKIVAHASVCLDCNWIDTDPDLSFVNYREYLTSGLSPLGRKKIRELCDELGYKIIISMNADENCN